MVLWIAAQNEKTGIRVRIKVEFLKKHDSIFYTQLWANSRDYGPFLTTSVGEEKLNSNQPKEG